MARSSHNLDPTAILHALSLTDPTSVTPVLGGADTAIWKVESGRDAYALRVLRPDQASVAEREVVTMVAAGAAGVPVPRVHATDTWQDHPVILLSWCPGRPLLHHLLRRPWTALSYGIAFGRTQAAIHAIAAPPALQGRSGGWLNLIDSAEVAMRRRLQAPDVRRDALIHLDYHPLNVMGEAGRITGVLDWSNAQAGDPRLDLARTKTILRLDMGRPALPLPIKAVLELLWALFERGWWQGYWESGASTDDLGAFYAAAGAIMQRDLGKRYTSRQLAHVRRWTERWKQRSGLAVFEVKAE